MKKPEGTKKGSNKGKQDFIKVDSYQVSRVRTVGQKDSVTFDLELNCVKIYGCFVVEGKDGDFISFPSRKGSDGNYYSIAYAYLSENDTKNILAEVERQLNNED